LDRRCDGKLESGNGDLASGRSGREERGMGSTVRGPMRMLAACAMSVGLLILGASPAPADPAEHEVFDPTTPPENVIDCTAGGGSLYTVTSGVVNVTFQVNESANGNFEVTGTETPKGVTAVDEDGAVYPIRGAVWFGGTINPETSNGQETFTGFLNILSEGGGVADRVAILVHFSPNGTFNFADFGTCAF
jgi:hypothetical protein